MIYIWYIYSADITFFLIAFGYAIAKTLSISVTFIKKRKSIRISLSHAFRRVFHWLRSVTTSLCDWGPSKISFWTLWRKKVDINAIRNSFSNDETQNKTNKKQKTKEWKETKTVSRIVKFKLEMKTNFKTKSKSIFQGKHHYIIENE